MDALSSVLSLLKPQNSLAAGLEAGGDWSIRFPDLTGGIKTGAIISGQCWLEVEGSPGPIRLDQGDCFLLPHGRPFRLASDLSLDPVDAGDAFRPATPGGMIRLNGGDGFSMISTRFILSGSQSGFLLGMLPAIVHVRSAPEQDVLLWSIRRIMTELRGPQAGGALAVDHLAHLMLIEALRLHLAAEAEARIGWLFALADDRVSQALHAIHSAPTERWTVESLASRAGMSRSSFAARFRALVGTSPMDYLIRWRMAVAGERLATGREPISAIALSVGYESEASFSTAFKRIMGAAPRRYARTVDRGVTRSAP